MTDLTTKQILIGMRELLSLPERWTQGRLAKDIQGKEIQPTSDEAVCWCLYGAACRIACDSISRLPDAIFNILNSSVKGSDHSSLILWQDDPSRTHAEVLAALDRAVELTDEATP